MGCPLRGARLDARRYRSRFGQAWSTVEGEFRSTTTGAALEGAVNWLCVELLHVAPGCCGVVGPVPSTALDSDPVQGWAHPRADYKSCQLVDWKEEVVFLRLESQGSHECCYEEDWTHPSSVRARRVSWVHSGALGSEMHSDRYGLVSIRSEAVVVQALGPWSA